MRKHNYAALLLAIITATAPASGDNSSLPRLQPPDPIFRAAAVREGPSVCTGVGPHDGTLAETVQVVVMEPLLAVGEGLADFLRQFSQAVPAKGRAKAPPRKRMGSPSAMIRQAGKRRMCS